VIEADRKELNFFTISSPPCREVEVPYSWHSYTVSILYWRRRRQAVPWRASSNWTKHRVKAKTTRRCLAVCF